MTTSAQETGAAERPMWAAIATLTALAAGLRLIQLDFQSLWSDEIGSLRMAQGSLSEIVGQVGHDVHPPLYFLLLRGWSEVFGSSESALRSLSVLTGVLAVPPLVLLGRRLFGRRAGLIAGALFATSLLQIYYAQEARGYSLMVLLAIASMEAFASWWESAGRWAWLRYVAASVALVYTHYFGFFVLLAQSAFALFAVAVERRGSEPIRGHASGARRLRSLALADASILACFAPWIPTWLEQAQAVRAGFWIDESSLQVLYRTPLLFASVLIPPWAPPLPRWIWIGEAAAALLAGFLLLALFDRRLGLRFVGWFTRRSPTTETRFPQGIALVVLWMGVPTLLPWTLSFAGLHIYTYRNAIAASPALGLLIGAAVAALPGRSLPILVLAAALAPGIAYLPWYYSTPQKDQWRETARGVEERLEPGRDGVVFDAPFVRRDFDFYAQRPYSFVDVRGPRPRQQRIWLIRAHTDDTGNLIPRQLAAWGYRRVAVDSFVEIEVWRYERGEASSRPP